MRTENQSVVAAARGNEHVADVCVDRMMADAKGRIGFGRGHKYADRSVSAWRFYCGVRAFRRGEKLAGVAYMSDAMGTGNASLWARARAIREWMMRN